MENYKVLDDTIGQGSFGKVAKVLHIPSGREMVWKVTNYGGMCEKERQQLYNEVKILREIKADYIVRCYDKFVDKENTSIYLVMEFCKGGDLAQLITKCREGEGRQYIGEDFIWRIFTQTVLALYECHRRKNKQVILHRDLKPSNIFLDEKMDAKLGDFGFAKALGRAGSGQDYAQTNLGSPYYMSPEQCNGQDYNEKSDIWSLGVVLYELAALNPPFMATNQLSLALKIKEGNFKRVPSRYSEELQRVIRWMLQVEPQDRPDVEDLLNLPHVSMRLRERALKRNLQHTKRKEEEVKRQEEKLKTKRDMIEAKEKQLDERESQIEALEKEVEAIQRELAEKDHQKQSLIRSAASRANFINKSHDAKPHSMIISNRNELVDTDDLLDDEQNSAHQHMTALNSQNYLKSSLEPTDPSAPLVQNVNNSCMLNPGKQSSGSKNLILKSTGGGSAQNMTPRSQGHDFTEIMGYKNIDISRDVDQSYMLKGSNNTNKKTNSSRNASKNEGDQSSLLMKDHHSNASQRALLAHQSYQQMTSPANQSLNQMRRSSRENLSQNLKPNASGSCKARIQPAEFSGLQRKGSLNQLETSTPINVGISTNSSTGALAGYYHSGAATNRVSSDSICKDASAVQCQPDDPTAQMIGRSQYPELYHNHNHQQKHQQQQFKHVIHTGSSQKNSGVDSSLIQQQQRNNSINSSVANLPSQFQLYGSQDNLTTSAKKATPSRQQLKRANSNSSSQDHYYGMVKKGGITDANSTMISNAVNMSVLSHGGGVGTAGNASVSGAILNTSTSGLPNHIYQSTSVNSSKDLSLIQQSLAKNFSKHFQQVSSGSTSNQPGTAMSTPGGQAAQALQSSHLREPSPMQISQDTSNMMLLNMQQHTRNISNQSRGSTTVAGNQGRTVLNHNNLNHNQNNSLLGEPSLITPVNQSNTTQNLTAIGLLTRQQSLTKDGTSAPDVDETFQSNQRSHLQHASVIKRSFDSVNESYANLNPCLESQNSNHYTAASGQQSQQQQQYMMQQQLQMAMASNLYNEASIASGPSPGGGNAAAIIRGSPLRASETHVTSDGGPTQEHQTAATAMNNRIQQRRGSAQMQQQMIANNSNSGSANQVTQSQTMSSGVASSAMGLPPRINASWQQSNSSHLPKPQTNPTPCGAGSAPSEQQTSHQQQQQTLQATPSTLSGNGEAGNTISSSQTILQVQQQRRQSHHQFEQQPSALTVQQQTTNSNMVMIQQQSTAGSHQHPAPASLAAQHKNSQQQQQLHVGSPPQAPTSKVSVKNSARNNNNSITANTQQLQQQQQTVAAQQQQQSQSTESTSLYQPKFTKKNLEKGSSTLNNFSAGHNHHHHHHQHHQQIQSTLASKPIARRMSSHEFKNAISNQSSGEQQPQVAASIEASQQQMNHQLGYYMKNASMIHALAQQKNGSHSSNMMMNVSAGAGSSSITHQQFVGKQGPTTPAAGPSGNSVGMPSGNSSHHLMHQHQQDTAMETNNGRAGVNNGKQPTSAQQQQYTGTMMTTKANSGGSGFGEKQQHQIKGVCKESLETLMRTAAKHHHTDYSASKEDNHHQTLGMTASSDQGAAMLTSSSTAPIKSTASKQHSSAQKQHQQRTAMLGSPGESSSSHRRMVGSAAGAQNSAAITSTAAQQHQQRLISHRGSANAQMDNNI